MKFMISGIKFSKILIALLIVFGLYSILPGFFFSEEADIPILSTINEIYLFSIEQLSNRMLGVTGAELSIKNHQVILNENVVNGFLPMTRFRKTMVIFMIIIWITSTKWEWKTLFSCFLIIVHFLINSIYMATGAYLATQGEANPELISIPETAGYLCLFTIIFFWYRRHKHLILPRLTKFKVNEKLLQNDFNTLIFGYIFIIIYYLLYNIYDYQIWIAFLFGSSQKILGILGYSAVVEPFYLIGDNGSIFMLKSCIGYKTILLFVLFIFLTGNTSNKVRWIYILSGFLLLNFANILRFVFLFIHVQKNGDYLLQMDVHDMYNYIIYAIVFMLWIIWFEKFAIQYVPDE